MKAISLTSILESLYALTQIPLWQFSGSGELLQYQFEMNCSKNYDFSDSLYRTAQTLAKQRKQPYFFSGPAKETYVSVFCPALDHFFLMGPVICFPFPKHENHIPPFLSCNSPEVWEQAKHRLSVVSFSALCHSVVLLCAALGLPCPEARQLYSGNQEPFEPFTELDFERFLYGQREKVVPHDGYNREQLLLNYVRRGDTKNLKTALQAVLHQASGPAVSDNEIEQGLFNLVACITLITRYAIEGGLNQSLAYNLSDYYIRKARQCRSKTEMRELLFSMSMDFTSRVSSSRQIQTFSPPVQNACEFIYSNLHYPIRLADIAKASNRAESYISSLFKKETGLTITDFIRTERLKEAKVLLIHSTLSCQAIAASLSFSSQSYFTETFRREFGLTPKEYRLEVSKR